MFCFKSKRIKHKLTYSKVIKGDIVGAFYGLGLGLIFSYCSMSVVGSVSVSFLDILILFWYVLLVIVFFFTVIACL